MKKTHKRLFAPLVLSLLAIGLTGCNEEDNGIFGSGNNDKLTLTSFDKGIDRQTGREAVARIDTEYSKGERDIDVTNIIGSFNTQNINDLERSIVLSNNFEGTLEDRYIEVNGRTIRQPIYELNSSNNFNYETTYRTLDLSGVSAGNYSLGNNLASSRGILTDLNNYPNVPPNVEFPIGSVCYVPVTTSDRSFFIFNDKNRTRYDSIDDWVDMTENRFSDNRNFSTIRSDTGINNQLKTAQIRYFAFDNEPEYIFRAVDYDDRIYEADYIDSNATRPNENSIRGIVDCTVVNEVAADFLENQIRRYY
ncbi:MULTISPECIES: hypothetical protein [unclassified Psychrobacter]|uniref:hypothetical protein n=1 Tax=unclassified Psychrobacter TaxID=196806 RepID=UPI00071E8F6A|nr:MULTISPECIES: hypothetical protein [unclassified Psychrobacter]OLF37131.1 hypothetical protein BTV98_09500 [Psychrobacter sp. Cmf 22.2]